MSEMTGWQPNRPPRWPGSASTPARPPRRPRGAATARGSSTSPAVKWALLLPFAVIVLFIPGYTWLGVLLLGVLSLLGYYPLPWEVWLKRRMDRDQGGGTA